MADTVDSKVLFSGQNLYTVRLTNVSDGTGETTVTKVDRSTLTGPDGVNAPSKLVVTKVDYDVQGFEGVALYWNDGTDELLEVLSGSDFKEYRDVGGMAPDTTPSALTDATGDILLTTNGTAASGDTYSIVIHFRLRQ